MSQITVNLPDEAAAELAQASREINRNPSGQERFKLEPGYFL